MYVALRWDIFGNSAINPQIEEVNIIDKPYFFMNLSSRLSNQQQKFNDEYYFSVTFMGSGSLDERRRKKRCF
jgi:hypothetical protein